MRIRAFAIIYVKERFLLIRESNRLFKNQWYFPGGALEENENFSTGLIREIKEEAGYDAAINGVCFIAYVKLPIARKGLYLYCSARIVGGTAKLMADENSLETNWFTRDEIIHLDIRGNLLEIIQQFDDKLPLMLTDQIHL